MSERVISAVASPPITSIDQYDAVLASALGPEPAGTPEIIGIDVKHGHVREPASDGRRKSYFVSLAATLRVALPAKRPPAILLAFALVLAVLMYPSTAAYAADEYRVEITNVRSGLKADVMWASQDAYQGVFLWRNNTSTSQEFDLLDSGGGFFRIQARHSGQCLMPDWRQGTYVNGTPVIQYPYCGAGYGPAEWRRGWVVRSLQCSGGACSTTGTAQPVLINRSTGRCLDAGNGAGGAPPVQAVLQQWDCIRYTDDWNAGNQIWRVGNAISL